MTQPQQVLGTKDQPPESRALAVVEAAPVAQLNLGMLQANTPKEMIASATAIATALKQVISDKGLAKKIEGKEYVQCEGWTTMGAMLGVTAQEESVVERACDFCAEPCAHSIFVATVGLYTMRDHRRVGLASAECGSPDETNRDGAPTWADRARYARRSMAITRATSKAFRITFSWIVVLAGYAPTPAEEVTEGGFGGARPGAASAPRIPGDGTKWNGHGGKLLSDPTIPPADLAKVRHWLEKKDAAKNAKLVAAINEELEVRRIAAEGQAVEGAKA